MKLLAIEIFKKLLDGYRNDGHLPSNVTIDLTNRPIFYIQPVNGHRVTLNGSGGMCIGVVDDISEKAEKDVIKHTVWHLASMLGVKAPSDLPVKEAQSFPADCNPYLHDAVSQGVGITDRWEAMWCNQQTDGTIEQLTLVDKKTGRRFLIDLPVDE